MIPQDNRCESPATASLKAIQAITAETCASVAGSRFAVNALRLAFRLPYQALSPSTPLGELSPTRQLIWMLAPGNQLAYALVRFVTSRLRREKLKQGWHSLTVGGLAELVTRHPLPIMISKESVQLDIDSPFGYHLPGTNIKRLMVLGSRDELTAQQLVRQYWSSALGEMPFIEIALGTLQNQVGIPYGFFRPQDVICDDTLWDTAAIVARKVMQQYGKRLADGQIPHDIVKSDPLLAKGYNPHHNPFGIGATYTIQHYVYAFVYSLKRTV